MGALIEVKTDGLAKLGEIFCQATGLTAYGNKKLSDAKAYDKITSAKTENDVAIIKAQGEEELAKFILERENRKLT